MGGLTAPWLGAGATSVQETGAAVAIPSEERCDKMRAE